MQEVKQELKEFLKHYKEEIRQDCMELMEKEMPQLTETLFSLYEHSGNRLKYEEVYFARRRFLAVLGLEAYREKQESGSVDQTVIDKLSQVIEDVCEEECWALPAHVKRAADRDWRITVDLFASETAQTLSDIGDTLKEDLPESCYRKIVDNVERRVFAPYFHSKVPYEPWEHVDTNWNAVCAGSIGSACLHLLRGKPDLMSSCLERICSVLPYYVSGFAEDGACMEGLSYFTYGMTYFVNFALELYDYTKGKSDLLRGDWAGFPRGGKDKRARMAAFQSKCFFQDGRTLSFSDGSSTDSFRVGLSCALALHFPEALLPNLKCAAGLHQDTCYRFAALKMDLQETEKYICAISAEDADNGKTVAAGAAGDGGIWQKAVLLPAAQWLIARSDNGVGMACKGGHNGEPHNHNDVGHFICEAGGVMFATDLGAGEYTKDYFGEGRYEIFCNSSYSHSVPVLAGEGQLPGRKHCCSKFVEEAEGTVIMELQNAYRAGLAEKLVRKIVFERLNGDMTIEDDFCMTEIFEGIIEENIVTQIRPVVQEGRVILASNGSTAYLTVEDSDGSFPELRVITYEHSNHSGIKEKVYCIRWSVTMKGRLGRSRMKIQIAV